MFDEVGLLVWIPVVDLGKETHIDLTSYLESSIARTKSLARDEGGVYGCECPPKNESDNDLLLPEALSGNPI